MLIKHIKRLAQGKYSLTLRLRSSLRTQECAKRLPIHHESMAYLLLLQTLSRRFTFLILQLESREYKKVCIGLNFLNANEFCLENFLS
jgi:hypothetical protein